MREPGFWLSPRLQGLRRRARAAERRRGRARAGGARADPRDPGVPRRGARRRSRPPSVLVDTALGMLGRRWRAAGARGVALGPGRPAAPSAVNAAARGARVAGALRHRAPGRDRARAPIPTPSPSARSSSAGGSTRSMRSSAGAPELWRYGLHLQEETEARARRRSPPGWASRPWRELVEELRGDAPELEAAASRLPRGAGPGARLRRGAGPGEHSAATPVDVVRHPVVPRVAGAVRGLRAAADLPRRTRPAGSTSPARRLAAACGGRRSQRRGHCRHAIPGDGRARGLSRPPPPAGDGAGAPVRGPAASLDAGHGRGLGALLRAAHGRGRATTGDDQAAALPAGEPALARHPDRARRRAPHPGHDAGGGGGLHGGAPADRAARAREAEVRRYCAWPTYQLCYAVGRRELLRLREAYRERDRRRLRSARGFHDDAAGVRRAAGRRWRGGAWTRIRREA